MSKPGLCVVASCNFNFSADPWLNRKNLCRPLQESSLAALIQHKTRMLAPFIKAARAAVKHEIQKENEPRHAHQPKSRMISKMIN